MLRNAKFIPLWQKKIVSNDFFCKTILYDHNFCSTSKNLLSNFINLLIKESRNSVQIFKQAYNKDKFYKKQAFF